MQDGFLPPTPTVMLANTVPLLGRTHAQMNVPGCLPGLQTRGLKYPLLSHRLAMFAPGIIVHGPEKDKRHVI